MKAIHIVPTFRNPALLAKFFRHLLAHVERVFAESAVVTIQGHSCPLVKDVDLIVIVSLNGEFSQAFDDNIAENMAVIYPSYASLDTKSLSRIDGGNVPIFRFNTGILQSDGLDIMRFIDHSCNKLEVV